MSGHPVSHGTIFNSDYYTQIWGSVHRHDYAVLLTRMLMDKYHPTSVLDIGTGCGHVVKAFRDIGIDAYGLECSDHAVRNSCAPGYVLKGTVTDIPFRDGRFDLVMSNGLWEYLTEDEIQPAWAECHRVGRQQYHNWDTSEQWTPPEHQMVTIKPRSWWLERMQLPKILLACPTHECKEYAFPRWLESVRRLTYPNIEVFVVDNSAGLDFTNRWKDEVPMVHLEVDQTHPLNRITKSMEVIRQKFLAGGYSYWFNLESDVLVPPNTIETMLKFGRDSDWISHCYPLREGAPGSRQQGIGCSLLTKALVRGFDFSKAGAESPDAWLWEFVRNTEQFKTMELWGYLDTQHLSS